MLRRTRHAGDARRAFGCLWAFCAISWGNSGRRIPVSYEYIHLIPWRTRLKGPGLPEARRRQVWRRPLRHAPGHFDTTRPGRKPSNVVELGEWALMLRHSRCARSSWHCSEAISGSSGGAKPRSREMSFWSLGGCCQAAAHRGERLGLAGPGQGLGFLRSLQSPGRERKSAERGAAAHFARHHL